MEKQHEQQQKVMPFQIIFRYGKDEYHITVLDNDAPQAQKGFRFEKQTIKKEVYEVNVTATGPSCGCKGFQFKGKCKHLFMLRKAQMLAERVKEIQNESHNENTFR